MKLYRFGEGDKAVYMISETDNVAAMRAEFHCQDHGGMPFEEYAESTQYGKCVEITSIDQVPKEDLEYGCYTCGTDFMCATIREFFDDIR